MRQEVLIGVERRRRWPDEQKLRVLSEVGVDGASMADVARRYDITRQHIYQWHREMRRRCEASRQEATFLPVQLAVGGDGSDNKPEDPDAGAPSVEIGLRNGRTIRTAADLPEPLLTRLIRIAEAA
jgi:transposase